MQPLLERFPILHSRNVDSTRAFLAVRSIELELSGLKTERAAFDVRYNGTYLPELWLGYIRYGAAVTARISPLRGDYWLQLPLHGSLESSLGRRRLQCDQRLGVITSPSEVHVVRSEAHAARLSVAIHGDALVRQLGVLLDDEPVVPLQFAAGISLEHGYGRSIARLLRCAAIELEREDWLRDPATARHFAEFIMTGLLLSHPNNYSHALRRRGRRIAPRDVRRVVEYVHHNVSRPMTLADLVRESGVAGRTLLKHFQDFKGVSPMRYVRNVRLQRARDELREHRDEHVAKLAARWGFAHAGRFSIEYRRRFGESPSQTLGADLDRFPRGAKTRANSNKGFP
jgi:AraC-like DNA-binding protein